ncbi:amino acid transporter [Heyndrickxia sporothermodurans]|nr:amino acid transporter [Heyndrickxia sporothermodurans]
MQNNLINNTANGQSENEIRFKREIGVFGGTNILMGIMIGSGIFYIGSYVMQRSGMGMGAALLAWLIGGIVTLLGALCFAELGAMIPKAGGIYVYLSKAYSPVVGYMFSFQSMLIGGPGSIAALAIALPSALSSVVSLSGTTIKLVAIIVIILFTFINYIGVKSGKIVQNLFNVAKLLPIILIILLGIFGGSEIPKLAFNPTNAGMLDWVKMFSFAVIASLWAYEGWTNLNTVAEEIKQPQVNLPKALIFSVGLTMVIYVLFNYAIYRVLPANQITESIENNHLYLGTDVANVFLGNAGTILVVIAMILAMTGSINGMILSFSRTYYAVARDKFFFKPFANLHPKFNTSHIGLLLQMVISILLVLTRNLDQLTSLVVFAGAIFNVLAIIAVPILRKKMPNEKRPYKVWGYPVTVIIAVVAFAVILLNNLFDDPITSVLGLLIPLVGAGVYLIFKRNILREIK